jgi:hypothetical protein
MVSNRSFSGKIDMAMEYSDLRSLRNQVRTSSITVNLALLL